MPDETLKELLVRFIVLAETQGVAPKTMEIFQRSVGDPLMQKHGGMAALKSHASRCDHESDFEHLKGVVQQLLQQALILGDDGSLFPRMMEITAEWGDEDTALVYFKALSHYSPE